MTDERLAEIEDLDDLFGPIDQDDELSAHHRRELLAEVKRLRTERARFVASTVGDRAARAMLRVRDQIGQAVAMMNEACSAGEALARRVGELEANKAALEAKHARVWERIHALETEKADLSAALERAVARARELEAAELGDGR
jgi:hypothetical protein